MPTFYTPPDMCFERTVPNVLIKNCDWTAEEIQHFVENLSEAEYNIYCYNDNMNDIQWYEGIRGMTQPSRVIDAQKLKHIDTLTWLKEVDNELGKA